MIFCVMERLVWIDVDIVCRLCSVVSFLLVDVMMLCMMILLLCCLICKLLMWCSVRYVCICLISGICVVVVECVVEDGLCVDVSSSVYGVSRVIVVMFI